MPTKIVMSKFGPEMTEGKIIRWLKSEGDAVVQGESILEVETEKAIVEIQSPADGILGPVLKGEESVAKVEEILGHVFLPDEIAGRKAPAPTPSASAVGESKNRSGGDGQQRRSDGQARISPLAKRLARKMGIDVNPLTGSGPNGRIIEADILSAAQPTFEQQDPASQSTRPALKPAIPSQVKQPVTSQALKTITSKANTASMPLSGLRATIANRMHESHQVTAPVTLTAEVCATALVELRTSLSTESSREHNSSIGYNELMIKIAAHALHDFRYMNARLEAGSIEVSDDVHIGLAVDTPRGLVVPVIRDAYAKGVAQIGRELRELIEKAHNGTASPEDLSGGTFTITNLGMFEIDAFTPIINLPQTAILGIGQIKPRPAVIDNQLGVAQMVWLSLTFNHRFVDGKPAAQFLQHIKKLVEKPRLLLL